MAEQLTFDLPARPSLARGDFFVSPANSAAVAALDRPEDWVNHRLALVGPKAAGKTHLAHVFAEATGAEIVASDALQSSDIETMGSGTALVIEEVDQLDPATEEAALHLVNLLAARAAPLLMTARTAPTRWLISLPDLKSRFEASSLARLDPPDDALFFQIILKLFADRQIAPEPALIPWLAARIERSFAAAERAVAALDRAALTGGKPVGRALAQQVLDI
ncbi:MAG: chromosomal replication initiator DnaA [Pseudomonadota bacterium]